MRILTNYFNAISVVFDKEWSDPDNYILTKSVGFEGLISALGTLIPAGEKIGDLSEDYFKNIFLELKVVFANEQLDFSSICFPSNSQSASRISKLIIDAHSKIYNK